MVVPTPSNNVVSHANTNTSQTKIKKSLLTITPQNLDISRAIPGPKHCILRVCTYSLRFVTSAMMKILVAALLILAVSWSVSARRPNKEGGSGDGSADVEASRDFLADNRPEVWLVTRAWKIHEPIFNTKTVGPCIYNHIMNIHSLYLYHGSSYYGNTTSIYQNSPP